jgi:Ser/Thr protein kinase RdoA (MazF antagonist)
MSGQGQYSDDILAGLTEMARGALPRYGYPADTQLTLLNVSENATFLAESATHGRSILRVHRAGYHSREAILSELAWINALREAQVIETAEPLTDLHGEIIQHLRSEDGRNDRHAVMFSFLEGTEPAPGDDLPPWFERLGETTAALHVFSRSWRRPESFNRHVWDTGAMFGTHNLWGPWRAAMGLSGEGEAIIGRAVERIEAELARYGKGETRFGLIHADLRLANLLVDGNRLKVIDFDDCGFSWFMYDFAAAVSFFEESPLIPVLRDAWLKGYERICPLEESDRAIIPTLVMARRILLTAWLASHSEIPLAKELGAGFTDVSVELSEDFLRGAFLASPSNGH